MTQPHRPDASQAIAKATADTSSGSFGAAMPRMVWDEKIAATNLSDPSGDAVTANRITLEDRIAIERYALAHRALNALTHKENDVVTRHYGFATGVPMDLREVAEDLDMSYNAVQKTHARAILAMRRALGVKRKGLKYARTQ